jgi:N-acetylneuraminate synthase
VAEAGVNHNGELGLALEMVHAAAEAGAEAVKFQSFRAQHLASPHAPLAGYQARTVKGGRTQREMLVGLELDEEAHRQIMERCRRLGLIFLSSPFDPPSADLLARLEAPAYKIASGEATNLPFLAELARRGLPLILSTGMCTLAEVARAVRTVQDAGCRQLALLHCVSDYPARPEDVNLLAMRTMRAAFGLPVGYSDHTLGDQACHAAVALGACIIEKHFTLDPGLPGPDQKASVDPAGLARLVAGVRQVEACLGNGQKLPARAEEATAAVARKSLVAARDLAGGKALEPEDLASLRPGTGISPAELPQVLGRPLRRGLKRGELITWEMLG